jgi:hypothetical protein
MPAPPPLSEPAIVNGRGTGKWLSFAGMIRIRFDGCVLSPQVGTPVSRG